MSLRKSLLIKNILPAIDLTIVGVLSQQPVSLSIYPVLPALIIIAVCFGLTIWISKKPTESFDEMARKSYFRAGSLSFLICVIAAACLLIFSQFKVEHIITISSSAWCFILAGMLIINVVSFLFFDIKGGSNE